MQRLTNFLRSSSSNSNTHNSLSLANSGGVANSNSGSSSNLHALVAAAASISPHRSFDISSPSEFQHCFSIQPELLSTVAALKASSKNTAKQHHTIESTAVANNSGEDEQQHRLVKTNTMSHSTASHILLSPVSSPNLRFKIMLPNGADKR